MLKGVRHIITKRLTKVQEAYICRFRKWQEDSKSIENEQVSGPVEKENKNG